MKGIVKKETSVTLKPKTRSKPKKEKKKLKDRDKKKNQRKKNDPKSLTNHRCTFPLHFLILAKYPFLKEALNGEKITSVTPGTRKNAPPSTKGQAQKKKKTNGKKPEGGEYTYLNNLLSKNIHTFNPRSKNRWKLVAQIESKTRNIARKCYIELLNMIVLTGLFNVMRDSIDILSTTSSPRKCIQKADIDFIFDGLYSPEISKEELLFYCLFEA